MDVDGLFRALGTFLVGIFRGGDRVHDAATLLNVNSAVLD